MSDRSSFLKDETLGVCEFRCSMSASTGSSECGRHGDPAPKKTPRSNYRYRTTIYTSQHRHESPIFNLGFIQEAEAFGCGKQRQNSGVERNDRPRGS